MIHEAKRLHYRIVIGGDFNLVVANNRRADLLLDLVHAFDLVISDDPQLHIDDSSWTNSHPIYGRRQIDFILFSRNIILDECHASDILDLGSDHRAVRAQLHLPKPRKKWTKPKVKRGWRPSPSYADELNAKLADHPDLTLETLGMLLVHCASKCSTPETSPSCCKPWQDAEVKRLVAERKGCRDRARRLELSKLILKAVRCAKRRYCTAEAKRILQEFRDLNRLNMIHDSPTSLSHDQQCSPDSFA